MSRALDAHRDTLYYLKFNRIGKDSPEDCVRENGANDQRTRMATGDETEKELMRRRDSHVDAHREIYSFERLRDLMTMMTPSRNLSILTSLAVRMRFMNKRTNALLLAFDAKVSPSSSSRAFETKEEKEQKHPSIGPSDISPVSDEQGRPTMGNRTTKSDNKNELTDRQVDMLMASTKFSAQQVHEWHQSFLRECPSGKLDRKQFVEIYQQFFPQGKTNKFCSLAFKAFDRDRNGSIDFNEFLTVIALTMSVEPKDRLDLAFTMYDVDGDGSLDRKEISRALRLIYDVNGHRSMQQEMLPETRARLIIEKFDLDADQKLSRDEFIRGCLNDAEIRKLLTP